MTLLWGFSERIKGENTIPLVKMIPGQIPGFLGSPSYQLATIIEKWGPLRPWGSISPVRLTEYFQGLDKDVLTTKERQLAASTVAWPLLNALNQAETRSGSLENENQLLKARIDKLEQELNVLMGKKPVLQSLGQVRSISIDDSHISEVADLVQEENGSSKSDLEVPVMADPLQLRPIITQKTKKVQDRPAGVPPDQWPPAETYLHVTARPYTPTNGPGAAILAEAEREYTCTAAQVMGFRSRRCYG